MLAPVDIQNKVFKKTAVNGYKMSDVDEFMEEVLNSYQELTNENYALKDKINMLNESIQYYRSMESTIQNVLILADKTAHDTKTEAYEKAESIKNDAYQKAELIKREAERRSEEAMEKARQELYLISQKIEELRLQYIAYKAKIKEIIEAQLALLNSSPIENEIDGKKIMDSLSELLGNSNKNEEQQKEEEKKENNRQEQKYYTKEYTPLYTDNLA